MSTSKETVLSKACKNGDLKTLKDLNLNKINFNVKSRSKEYDNLFQRCFYESRFSTKEYEVLDFLTDFISDLNSIITEDNIIYLFKRDKYKIIDCLITKGLKLDNKSVLPKYKSIYDRLFRDALICRRIDNLTYLIGKFDISLIDISSVVRLIVNNEDASDYIDAKLNDTIDNFDGLFNFLIKNGLDISEVIDILK